ncbi:uncharacterized protein [Elaeis guineensis]|uniref:uncharacterized protein n=1 Tax=Elaeis guineensis var. tenera TaxID=51953 RepID=UPI003C6D614E
MDSPYFIFGGRQLGESENFSIYVMSETAARLPWLEDFVKTKFHNPCPKHGDSKSYLCGYYCTNCRDKPFCFQCHREGTEHKNHLVLQVRRASEHSAIEVDDINKFLDTSAFRKTRRRDGWNPMCSCQYDRTGRDGIAQVR